MKNSSYGLRISAVMTLLVLSVGLNAMQAEKIRRLVVNSRPGASIVGRPVSSISGSALDGQPLTVRLQGQMPTVIYHFSSTCGWCDRNWGNVEALASAGRNRYRVIAVSNEKGLKDYVLQRALSVDVMEQLSSDSERLLNLTGTPKTIIVGADGIITHEWAGAYTNRLGGQVEELFDVRLPGLAPITSTVAR